MQDESDLVRLLPLARQLTFQALDLTLLGIGNVVELPCLFLNHLCMPLEHGLHAANRTSRVQNRQHSPLLAS